jgi:hypothetical protein
MTGEGSPGHAADDAGGDDRPLPLRYRPRFIGCHL